MNTPTSIKHNLSKIAVALLILTQLVGCYAETGAQSKDRVTSLNDEITETDSSNNSTTATGSNTKTLSWVAPVAREDESPIAMSEISGYRVYYGTETGNYFQSIAVNDAYVGEITLNNLNASGTYYVVVTTIDVDGRESAYSDEIVINV